jgi:hypothetical protein
VIKYRFFVANVLNSRSRHRRASFSQRSRNSVFLFRVTVKGSAARLLLRRTVSNAACLVFLALFPGVPSHAAIPTADDFHCYFSNHDLF